MLPEVKQAILNTSLDLTEPLVKQIIATPFHDEIHRLFEQVNRSRSDRG